MHSSSNKRLQGKIGRFIYTSGNTVYIKNSFFTRQPEKIMLVVYYDLKTRVKRLSLREKVKFS